MFLSETKIELIDIKQIILYTVMFLLNCFACQNTNIGYLVAFAEATIVILYVILGKTNRAIIANNVFLGFSIEVSTFVFGEYKTIYSYAFMPYLHRYGVLIVEIIILFFVLFNNNFAISFGSGGRKLWRNSFVKGFSLIVLIGFLVSSITYLANDNSIGSLEWYHNSYVSECVYWLTLLLNIVIIHMQIEQREIFPHLLRKSLVSFFISMVIASWATVVLGFHGAYSTHQNVLMMPLASFFGVLLFLLLAYPEYKKKVIGIFAGLMFVCQIIMTTPLLGKWVILIILAVIAFLWITLSRGQFVKALLIGTVILLGVVFVGNYFISNNQFLQYKVDQALGIFNILSKNGLQDLSDSPLIRIEEFVNTTMEYWHKPFYILFGKGIGGTTLHWTKWTSWNNLSAFTANQFSSNVFMEMHESINVVFLKFGLCGLIFFINTIFKCIKNLKKSPWLFIGIMWFVLFINSYISLYIMSAVLMLGIYESDEKSFM